MTNLNNQIKAIMDEGNTFEAALDIMIGKMGITLEEMYDELRAEEDREDSAAVYEMETKAENAWLEKTEYDPEAQDEMRREDLDF